MNISLTMRLKAVIAIFALLGLTACGSSGGGGSSTGSPSTGATDAVVLQGNLAVATGDSAASYTVFNSKQAITPSAAGAFSMAVAKDSPTYTYAISATGDKVYAAINSGADSAVTINAQSTAEALVLLNPLLIPSNLAERATITAIVKADPAVQTLANVIDSVYSSSATAMTDSQIADALTTAVLSVLQTWQASPASAAKVLKQVTPMRIVLAQVSDASNSAALQIMNNDMGALTLANSAGSNLKIELNDVGPYGLQTDVDWVVRIVELDSSKIQFSPSGAPVLGNPTNITDIDSLLMMGGYDQTTIVGGAIGSGLLGVVGNLNLADQLAQAAGSTAFPSNGVTLPHDGVYAVIALSGSPYGDTAEFNSVISSPWQNNQAAQALAVNIIAAATDVVSVGTNFAGIDISTTLEVALVALKTKITGNLKSLGTVFVVDATKTAIDTLLDYLKPLIHSSISNLQATGLKTFLHIAVNTVGSALDVWSGSLNASTRIANLLFNVTPRESGYALLNVAAVTPDSAAPSVPTGLTANALSSSQIALSWNASTDDNGVTAYKIYRDGNLIASPAVLSFNDTALNSSTQYCYSLSAVDGAGNGSVQSSAACATTQSTGTASLSPAAPSSVIATAGDGQVTMTWAAVTGATSYNIYFAAATGVSKSNYNSLTGGAVSAGVSSPYVQSGLTNDMPYYYVVTAVNANGESVESSEVSATPRASNVAAYTVTEFSVGISAYSLLYGADIAAGADGNLWFSESRGNQIGRITPTGTVTEFGMFNGLNNTEPGFIAAGPDGNIWFVEMGRSGALLTFSIGRSTPAGNISEFAVVGLPGIPAGIVAGPDGNLWITASNNLVRMTTSGVTSTVPILNSAGYPNCIAAGADGNLWYTNTGAGFQSTVARVTTAGATTEFDIGTNIGAGTRCIAAGPDGNLWIAASVGNSIVRLTPAGVAKAFSSGLSTNAKPESITAGSDGNLWFTEPGVNKIGRITTDGVITEFDMGISADAGIAGIASGPDGNIWFTETKLSRIGRLTIK